MSEPQEAGVVLPTPDKSTLRLRRELEWTHKRLRHAQGALARLEPFIDEGRDCYVAQFRVSCREFDRLTDQQVGEAIWYYARDQVERMRMKSVEGGQP